jgi:pyrroloquinoline quinone biosynthesis protein D
MPATDSVPLQRPGVRLEEMDGETLLYRHTTRKSIYLNESATVVWKLCDGQRTVQQIIDVLAETYPDGRASITADVWYANNGLVREGALRLEAPISPKEKTETNLK